MKIGLNKICEIRIHIIIDSLNLLNLRIVLIVEDYEPIIKITKSRNVRNIGPRIACDYVRPKHPPIGSNDKIRIECL